MFVDYHWRVTLTILILILPLFKKYPAGLPRRSREFSESVGASATGTPDRPCRKSLFRIQDHFPPCQSLSGPLAIASENSPLTGSPTLPFSIKYPSLTSNTKSPFTVLTCPPPIFLTNNPFSTERTISSGLVLPGAIRVLLIRGMGFCWYDSLLPFPVDVTPSSKRWADHRDILSRFPPQPECPLRRCAFIIERIRTPFLR